MEVVIVVGGVEVVVVIVVRVPFSSLDLCFPLTSTRLSGSSLLTH